MATILIYACLAIIAAALLLMVGFGAKNASFRLAGESKVALAAFALPVVVLVIVYLAAGGDWATAAVWTALIMALSGLASLLISGARNLVS